MADIIGRMLPPNFEILPNIVKPTIETIQISIWGTTLAIVFTIPFGLIAARNISPHPLLYHLARFVLNADAFNIGDYLYLIFVAAVGLGDMHMPIGWGAVPANKILGLCKYTAS